MITVIGIFVYVACGFTAGILFTIFLAKEDGSMDNLQFFTCMSFGLLTGFYGLVAVLVISLGVKIARVINKTFKNNFRIVDWLNRKFKK